MHVETVVVLVSHKALQEPPLVDVVLWLDVLARAGHALGSPNFYALQHLLADGNRRA